MTTSMKNYDIKALLVIAKQRNDEVFNDLIRKIIKIRYKEMEMDPFFLSKAAKDKEFLELEAIGELVIDRSIDESFIVSDKMIDKIINSLSFDYLMIAYNQSKNQNIKNRAFVKINEMLDEIEKDNLLRQELYEKINDDINYKNNEKVRRKRYGKY